MEALSGTTLRVTLRVEEERVAHALPVPAAWVRGARWWKSSAYLIRGQAKATGFAYVRELTFRLLDGTTVAFNVLVTKKGRMLEMVALGAPPVSVTLGSGDAIFAKDITLELRQLSRIEYRYRQVRRVIPVLCRQSLGTRANTGLAWSMLVVRLNYAYAQASRLRMGAYAYDYGTWFNEFCRLSFEDRRAISHIISDWPSRPHFSIIVVAPDAKSDVLLERTLASLELQAYREFSVTHVSGDGWQKALPAPISLSSRSFGQDILAGKVQSANAYPRENRWAILLPEGCELAEQALFWIAHAAQNDSSADLVYTDHDVLDEERHLSAPSFKPDWSSELLRSINYIGNSFAWRVSADGYAAARAATIRYASLDAGVHRLLLSMATESNVLHVPAPLWHMPLSRQQGGDTEGRVQGETPDIVVADYLADINVDALVHAESPTRNRVRYCLPRDLPLISIVIPTRDGMRHLRPCIESIIARTTYPNFEILVVDNQSVESETLAYFEEIGERLGVRICKFNEPFNYSRMNNFAVSHVNGALVCLLNNDTEVISGDWLEEMAGRLLQPSVGAVGAKLLFADGTVQHAGDTVGPGGCADHLHAGIGCDDPGYGERALVAQELSAVTAACLLTTVDLYKSLGGLDEKNLPIAFNDVDFCLRVREAGHRVVWTPHALLYHHESVSRGKDETPERRKRAAGEVRYMRKRWARAMEHDPFYNPNLNYQRPDFALAAFPRVKVPWIDRKP